MPPIKAINFTAADAVSLRDHIQALLDAQRAYYESRLAALEKATEVATDTLNTRLAGMNEFRDTLKDQAGRFVTRDELGVRLDRVQAELNELRQFRDQLTGAASQKSVNVALLFSILSLALGVLGVALRFWGGG